VNILHITPYYAPAYPFGGVVRAVEGMAQALLKRGHNITVLTTDALSQTERYAGALDEILDGVRVVRVRNASLQLRKANLSTPRGFSAIAQELLTWADITHVHEFRTIENLQIAPLAARMSQPLILSPHGTLTLSTGRSTAKATWDRLFSRRVARRLSAVIGLTENELDDVRVLWASLRLELPPLFVVPNGVNAEQFDRPPGGALFREAYGLDDAVVCLFVGRLHPRKGIDVLIRAFQAANVPHTRLVIAGPDEGMMTTIKPLLDERIILTGYLDSETRLAALAAADIFALPATGEGLSMASLEALAAGLPVILSPGCNLPEVETYGAGLIVDPEIESLTHALQQLLTDNDLRRQMSANAHDLIYERFTWDTIGASLDSIYQKFI
jgi:glycosyltransferase involved in cell wall biosynthesis